MKFKCIIIEDEPLAIERTKSYVDKIQFLDLLNVFENPKDAIDFIRLNTVDIIFLDINMGEISGIELLERTKTKSRIIFTTAYHEYALKGYELNITDYLLKPFTFERFLQAVNKVVSSCENINNKNFIFIKTEYRLEKIFLNEIIYIEGMRDYRRIHCFNKKIMTLQTFKDLEQEIPATILCRVHKSFMVALDKIDSVERDRIKIKEIFIPISETYKQMFFELLKTSK